MTDKEGDGPQAGADQPIVPTPAEGDDTPATDPALEAEAREMGWVPKDKFRGDPDTWRDAGEFVKRGKEILPILNARLKSKDAELAELKRTSADTISRIQRASETGLKMQREMLVARYEAAKLKAVEQGDTKAYTAVEKAQSDELKKFDAAVKDSEKGNGQDQPADGRSVRDKTIMEEWMADNPWFSERKADKSPKNPVLWAAANEEFENVEAEMPGASMADKLAEVRKRVEAEFPARFGKKANGNGSPRVESANGRGPEGGNTDTGQWNKVPQEVRGTARNQIEEEGLFNHLVGAKPDARLTPAQLKQAREIWAEKFFNPGGRSTA